MTAAWLIVESLLLLILFAVSLFVPGWIIIRRFRWSNIEKIPTAIALSLLIIYLLAELIYLAHLPWSICYLITLVFCLFGYAIRTDLLAFWRNGAIRYLLASYGLLLTMTFSFLAITRHYSGGGWGGDFLEHFERVQYFFSNYPPEHKLIEVYYFPARPPLMNLITAFFLSQIEVSYQLFQVAFCALNTLVYFACIYLMSLFYRLKKGHYLLVAIFLSFNPAFQENSIYAWTKLFAAFFLLMMLSNYLRATEKNDLRRMLLAAVFGATALLAHYSAGPYLVFFALHYLCIWFKRQNKIKEPLLVALAGGSLLASWFVWSVLVYGSKMTFAANSSMTEFKKQSFTDYWEIFSSNLYNTFIPHPFVKLPLNAEYLFVQISEYGYWRDYFFMIYQTCFPWSLGIVSAFVGSFLFFKALKNISWSKRLFWISFIVFNVILGIAVIGTGGDFGAAQICLLPITLAGIALVAVRFLTLNKYFRYLLVVGLCFDLTAGVVLQFRMQQHFPLLYLAGSYPVVPIFGGLLGLSTLSSAALITESKVRLLGHALAPYAPIFWLSAILVSLLFIFKLSQAAAAGKFVYYSRLTLFSCFALILVVVGFLVCLSDFRLEYELEDMAAYQKKYPRTQVAATLKSLMAALPDHPENAKLYYLLGVNSYRLNDFGNAVKYLNEALLLNPADNRARFVLGFIFIVMKMPGDAFPVQIADLVNYNPGNTAYLEHYAQVLNERGYVNTAATVRSKLNKLNKVEQ
ncbi:MAG: glycosyltransferase family 39 protein [Deltaproteobacteria bacterium]|nr:glycosyltransferase family 39 protein [Deltaproteobacteria bacterium]